MSRFEFRNDVTSYRLRNTLNKLILLQPRNNYLKRIFSYSWTRLWKCLSRDFCAIPFCFWVGSSYIVKVKQNQATPTKQDLNPLRVPFQNLRRAAPSLLHGKYNPNMALRARKGFWDFRETGSWLFKEWMTFCTYMVNLVTRALSLTCWRGQKASWGLGCHIWVAQTWKSLCNPWTVVSEICHRHQRQKTG